MVANAKRRAEIIEAYRRRFEIGRVFSLLLRQSVVYAFKLEFLRFIDNARVFGFKFELARQAEGWQLVRSKN
jgi:uncharacterized protein YhbP (UPF0306 family)